jgi:hypothetical protein
MVTYRIKLHKVWESTCEIEVKAGSEQEAIAMAENSVIDEEEWSDLEVTEQYVADVSRGE